MKKILSIILALSLVLGLALTASAAASEETKAIKATEGTVSGDSITWTGTNFKLVNEKYNSTSNIRTSDSDHFRVYKNSKVTITALNGEKLAKIAITTTGGDYFTALVNSLGTPANATVSTSGNVVTITLTTAAESFEIVATAAQWRLNNIVVTYAEEGVCNHPWDNCADTTCNQNCGETRTAGTCTYINEYDATCENCGDDREVTLPEAGTELTYEQADKLAKAGVSNVIYKLTGTVKNVVNTTYGNMYIEDENGNEFYIYGLYSADGETRYDAMTDKPEAGDTITVSGKLSTYNGDSQMKNAWLVEEPANTADNTPVIALVTLVVLSAAAFVTMISLKKREF